MESKPFIKNLSNKIENNTSDSGSHKDKMRDLNCLALGQLLWARGVQCSWWPAQVVDERTISDFNIVNERIEGGVLVRFYGSYTYAWVDPLGDSSQFQESFKGKGSNHVRAFQKALEEMLLQNKLNKSCAEFGEMSKQSATPSKGKLAVDLSSCKTANGEEPEQTRSQGKPKEKASRIAPDEEPEKVGKIEEKAPKNASQEAGQIQSQGKRKEKSPKSGKGEEAKQIGTQGKKKEKVSKRAKVEEAEEIQSQCKREQKASKSHGKREEKVLNSAKGEEAEQIKNPGKRKENIKTTKRSTDEEPAQIQSPGMKKERAPKRAKDKECDKIQNIDKRKDKALKTGGEEPEKIDDVGNKKGRVPKNSKGEETQQISNPGKRKEKASSDVSQRSQGKKKDKASSDIEEIVADGSEKKVRQMKVMRQLGLAAPAGSPFSAEISVNTAT